MRAPSRRQFLVLSALPVLLVLACQEPALIEDFPQGETTAEEVAGVVLNLSGQPSVNAYVDLEGVPSVQTASDGTFRIAAAALPATFIVSPPGANSSTEIIYRTVSASSPVFLVDTFAPEVPHWVQFSGSIAAPPAVVAPGNYLITEVAVLSTNGVVHENSSINTPQQFPIGGSFDLRETGPLAIEIFAVQFEYNQTQGPVRFIGTARKSGLSAREGEELDFGILTLTPVSTVARNVILSTPTGLAEIELQLYIRLDASYGEMALSRFGLVPPEVVALQLPELAGATFSLRASAVAASGGDSANYATDFAAAGPALEIALPDVPKLDAPATDAHVNSAASLSWSAPSSLPLCSLKIFSDAGRALHPDYFIFTTERELPLSYLIEKPGVQLQTGTKYQWRVACYAGLANVDEAVTGDGLRKTLNGLNRKAGASSAWPTFTVDPL